MRTFLAAAMLLATLSPAMSQAQPKCGPGKELLKTLQDKYKEVGSAIGMINEKQAFLIVASPDGKSWTALVYNTDGTACVVAGGTDLSPVTIKPGGQGI